MSESLSKKKSKKRRKGKGGKVNGAADQPSKTPEQVTEKENQVITTSKCSHCKGTYRQLNNQISVSLLKNGTWNCPSCVQELKSESSHSALASSRVLDGKDSLSPLGTSGCNCSACVAKRENAVTPDVERDAHITQTYWMEIRHVVRCIYRENVSLTNQNKKASIGSEKMQMIVKKLCSRDPHQFFQRLETLAREYLLEVKVRLLEQLSCGFNSPQLAIEFIQMLLEEYSTLCTALPALLYLLKPLEDCEYVQKLGMTVELMNKNIFRELIFAESFMSSNLPLIIAQLRLASLADHFHHATAKELNQRYVNLDQEMEDICRIWKTAKDHLTNQHYEDQKSHFDRIKADGESFKQQVLSQHSNTAREVDCTTQGGSNGTCKVPSAGEASSSSPSIVKSIATPYSDCSDVAAIQDLLQAPLNHNQLSSSVESGQAAHWARLLFKCIKPSPDTDFSLTGNMATHTITLHLDMTQLNLLEAKPCCTHADLTKYCNLGLTVQEIVEVAMKLSSLRSLGLNIKIEDLFDDEGFSLSDINELVLKRQCSAPDGSVLSAEEDSEAEHNSRCLAMEERVDLERVKESILQRYEGGELVREATSRQQDFLRGLTMKIRFRKTLTAEDLEEHFIADNGKVMFTSCDQVQMKLTHMEMNSTRLITCCNSVGDVLGLERHDPLSTSFRRTREDYIFVHTNSHREFMELLLEKRKQLENNIISGEEERRKKGEEHQVKVHHEHNRNGSLPRYQVKDQQESVPATLDDPVKKSHFKPLYYSKDRQPCQCSACVGAVATIISSCSLVTHLGVNGKLQDSPEMVRKEDMTNEKNVHPGSPPTSSVSPLSKEGLWQNWMSTSGSAQLENESHASGSHQYCHHRNGASNGGHCCRCGDKSEVEGDQFQSCNHRDTDSTNGCTATSTCSNHHGSSSCLAGDGDSADGSLNSVNSTSNSSSGEHPRRYCPCCYCELFGHNVPPTAPTSHNYTKRRDIMRQKLEEKKRKRREHNTSKLEHPRDEEQQTSVEELLAFIEGGDGEESEQSKLSKRQRKKQKKLQVPLLDHDGGNAMNRDDFVYHQVYQDSIAEMQEVLENGSNDKDAKVNGDSKRKKPQSMMERIGNYQERKTESADANEYDDELEEFKRFCFADAPSGPRKKIAVTLNMHDIMSKLSN